MLPFPAEAADAAIARRDVAHDRRPSADAIAIAIVGIGTGENRFVRNGLDEAHAEERNRNAARNDHGLRGQLHLTTVERRGEQLEQRLAVR